MPGDRQHGEGRCHVVDPVHLLGVLRKASDFVLNVMLLPYYPNLTVQSFKNMPEKSLNYFSKITILTFRKPNE